MKLQDIIEVDVRTRANTKQGDPLDMLTSTSRISRQSHTAAQAQRIKELLSKHKINGVPAWSAPIDGSWNSNLDTAIKKWKKSINAQVGGKPRLQSHLATIAQVDLQYLRAPLTADGRIKQQDRGLKIAGKQQNPFAGETYTGKLKNPNPKWTGDVTTDMATMVSSIGFSGWIAIINQANNKVGKMDMQRRFSSIASYYDSPARWLNAFRTDVVRDDVKKTFTMPNGEERLLIGNPNLATGVDAPKKLWNYYSTLAQEIMISDAKKDAAVQQDIDDAGPNRGVGTNKIKQLATQLVKAFKFGITTGGTDEDAVKEVLIQLRTREDYEQLMIEYQNIDKQDLNERLTNELNEKDYNAIVYPQLLRIGVINHSSVYRMIKFDETDKVKITYNGINYEVKKIKGEVKDAVTPDVGYDAYRLQKILEEALVKTGGQLPRDIQIEPNSPDFNKGRAVFESVVQDNYPEMVAWYTHQQPFDVVANVGSMRAKGIVDELAKMASVGSSAEDLLRTAVEMVKSDRAYLVDNLRIYFAREYATETSSPSDGFAREDSITDEKIKNAEVLESHQEWAKTFKQGSDEEIMDAIREILQSENPEKNYFSTWVEYANVYGNKGSKSLDMDLGDGWKDVKKFFVDNNPDSPLGRMLESDRLRPGVAAPNAIAKWLDKEFGGRMDGTGNEDAILGCINFISKEDFQDINSAWRELGYGNGDLIATIKREDAEIFNLAVEKFKLRDEIVKVSTVEMPYGQFKLEGPDADGMWKGIAPASIDQSFIPIPRNSIEYDANGDEIKKDRQFWLGWQARRWQTFGKPGRSGNPRPVVPQEILDELFELFNELGRDEEGIVIKGNRQ